MSLKKHNNKTTHTVIFTEKCSVVLAMGMTIFEVHVFFYFFYLFIYFFFIFIFIFFAVIIHLMLMDGYFGVILYVIFKVYMLC